MAQKKKAAKPAKKSAPKRVAAKLKKPAAKAAKVTKPVAKQVNAAKPAKEAKAPAAKGDKKAGKAIPAPSISVPRRTRPSAHAWR